MDTIGGGTHSLLDTICNLSSSTLAECIHRSTTTTTTIINNTTTTTTTNTTIATPFSSSSSSSSGFSSSSLSSSSSSSSDPLIDINDFNGLDYSAVALAVDNFSYSILQLAPGAVNRSSSNLSSCTSHAAKLAMDSSNQSSSIASSFLSSSLPLPSPSMSSSMSPSSSGEDVYEMCLTDADYLYRHSSIMTLVYCIAYIIVFIVGLVGNSFVIAVVLRAPRMRTVTNYFIVNLAIADILVIVFCLPATLMSNIFVPWVLGWLMCKTVTYVQGVSVAASVYSLIAVSLDRFIAIWWPLKQMTKSRARFMIFCIWVIALGSTIPWILFFDLVPASDAFPMAPDMFLCQEVWPPGTDGNLYFLLAQLVACYLLPMALITLCYVLIWIKVSTRSIPGDSNDGQMEQMQQKSKVKVIKMLVAVVILFVLSWLPLYVIFARIKFGGEITQREGEILNTVTPIAQWLGSSNSCINPILYAFFNKKYRRGFAAIIKSRSCCGRLRYYDNVLLVSSSASTRKSFQYQQNSKKSPGSPIRKPNVVSYIYEQNALRRHNLIIKQDSNLSQQMLLKQDSHGSRQMLIKQESASSDGSRRMLCKQDSNGSKMSLTKQDSVISYIETKRGFISQQDRNDSFSTQDTISIDSRRGTLCKQDTQYSYIEHRKNCLNQDSNISPLELKRQKLQKQDSVISFADQRPEPRRHQLVKQDSVISFADQRRGFLQKQDSIIGCPSRNEGAAVGHHVSILKKTDSQSSNGNSPRRNIEFSE